MQTITYREQPLAHRTLLYATLGLITLGEIAWTIYEFRESGGKEWDLNGLWIVLIVWIAILFITRHVGRKSVTLDDEGLNYTNGWTSRRWAWAELSAPEIFSRDGRVDPYIRFRPGTLDWMARLTWWSWRTRPEIRIPFTYDAPLTEIVAKLTEYRTRALGS